MKDFQQKAFIPQAALQRIAMHRYNWLPIVTVVVVIVKGILLKIT